PLARMVVAVGSTEAGAALLRHQYDVLEELNVKAVELLDSSAGLGRYRGKTNLRLPGPRLRARPPERRAAAGWLDAEPGGGSSTGCWHRTASHTPIQWRGRHACA